jgi:hypothetical protein
MELSDHRFCYIRYYFANEGISCCCSIYDDIQISRLRLPTKSPKFRSFT